MKFHRQALTVGLLAAGVTGNYVRNNSPKYNPALSAAQHILESDKHISDVSVEIGSRNAALTNPHPLPNSLKPGEPAAKLLETGKKAFLEILNDPKICPPNTRVSASFGARIADGVSARHKSATFYANEEGKCSSSPSR